MKATQVADEICALAEETLKPFASDVQREAFSALVERYIEQWAAAESQNDDDPLAGKLA